MCGAVEEVPELDEAVRRQAEIPGLEPLLEEQSDVSLEIDDVERVAVRDAVRVAGRAAGRSEVVPDRRVHEVDRGDVDDLAVDRPCVWVLLQLAR